MRAMPRKPIGRGETRPRGAFRFRRTSLVKNAAPHPHPRESPQRHNAALTSHREFADFFCRGWGILLPLLAAGSEPF